MQRDRSDDEDKYRRRRDGDRRGRDRDRSDTEKVTDRRDRYRNRSEDEDGNDRRRRDRNRDRDRDRRNGDEYVSNKGGARKTSDDEEYDDETRRGRSRVLKGDDDCRDSKRNEDRRRRSRSVEDNGDGRSNRKTSEDGKRRKEVAKKHEENSDGEDGEIRKTEIKGKREDVSDDEDGEIRKRGTKGKDRSDGEDDRKDRNRRDVRKSRSDEEDDEHKRRRGEEESDDEAGEIRKRGTKGKDRSDDEDDRKDRRRRDMRKSKSDEEDDKYKRRRDEEESDDEDRKIRKRGRKGKDRRSDDEEDRKDRRRRDRYKNRSDDEDDKYKNRRDSKRDRRRGDDVANKKNDKNGETETVDEGPRFQKLAEMQENMTNLGKTGGVYIPPFKLARMMSGVQDKSSMEYQRMTWDALRKSINGLVNKVNATNIKNIIPELFAENLIRGRGLFCRSCMKSQMASPGFTDVFAALVAVVNTKFPEVGDLLLRRIILQLQRAYKRNDKHQLLAAVKFIAHLVNQQVVHELIALELLTLLLENPTDDSVEVAVGFVTECGSILQDLSPKGLHGIFERFRGILHEGEIDKRVQFLIEGLFALRKAKFQGHAAVRPELDLVELEDQLTHEVSLLDKIDPEISLDIFKMDPDFLENEKRYEDLKKTILGDESSDEDDDKGGEESDDDDEDESSEEEDEEQMRIRDETETNLVNLRRTIYLTIMSSVDFEEAGHKLLKIKLEPGQEMELCIMLLECCSQERTYLRYYGLLGQRFCMINKVHQENFEKCFVQQYSMIHRLETNKLRNVAKFFAHLLGTDALPWHVLAYIRLTEEDTTSSSRIFIKILFQELSEHLGIRLLNERLSDPSMQADFESIFPRDNPKNTRFSINFFTSIGLGGITENLREYLKNMPRLIMQQKPASESDDSGSSSSGSESSSSEESESSSESSDSERDQKSSKRRRRR
ncbi:putative MIF4G-like, type 3, initiation factor eIF-4 gamma, MA3, MIF4G-like domain superfamily [Helianthus annuus]|nr:putative MIF4G-like, type 3, initiation factor eIF-4 gamma, MA3, MIF4G-like domain superfamily [Helianthus annuus]